ncbi:MAG: hypothetical protein DRJ66_06470 [Thermoprotei archaeon]|nr:MAG: hypothetical protein DRJ66_06470 [Thermoprotei archaeon]
MGYISAFVDVSLIVFLGFIASYLFERHKVPEAVILIIAGILIGPVFKIISPTTFEELLSVLSNVALVVVLFEAGLSLNLSEVLKNVWKAMLTSALYLVLSSIIISFPARKLLGLSLIESFLPGAILGGASSVVAIPLIRGLTESDDVKAIITLDSTFSDTLVIVVSLALMQFISNGNELAFSETLHSIVSSFSIGLVFGLFSGIIWIKVLKSLKNMKFSYMLTLAFLLLLYSLVEIMRGSGAIACLMVGLLLSNAGAFSEFLGMEKPFRLRHIIVYFHEEITFFIRTFFYIALGILFDVQYISYSFLWSALVIISCMIFARYLALSPVIKSGAERLKLSFMVPHGLAAAAVASLILQYDIISKHLLSSLITTEIVLSNLMPIFSTLLRRREKRREITNVPMEKLVGTTKARSSS